MMKQPYLCLLLLVCSSACAAAPNADERHRTIDQTVWRPFQQAFQNLDGAALNSVYAAEVLRATPEGIDTRGSFKTANLTRFDASRARGEQLLLDFWFDSRRTNEDTSYEVGFYRIQIFPTGGGEPNEFFGQFHIVLRKIKGAWKITQDWDTDSIGGVPITAELFARQPPSRF